MSGRVTAIDVVVAQPEIMGVVLPCGLWKSDNAGTSWAPIFEDQEVASIGALSVFSQSRCDLARHRRGQST